MFLGHDEPAEDGFHAGGTTVRRAAVSLTPNTNVLNIGKVLREFALQKLADDQRQRVWLRVGQLVATALDKYAERCK